MGLSMEDTDVSVLYTEDKEDELIFSVFFFF